MVKAGYKQTEIGEIPEDWEVNIVGNAYLIANNLRLPISREARQKVQGPYPYYGPTRIQDYINEYRIEGKYALIGEDGDHFLKYSTFPQTQMAVGKFNVNNHAHLVSGNKNTPEWFYLFFKHRDITQYLTRQGANRFKLNKAALESLPCALPPRVEQKAIADALSDVDGLIGSLEKLIAKKRDMKTAAMQQLLTGKKRLPGFSGKWQRNSLFELCDQRKELFDDGDWVEAEHITNRGVRLIQTGNIGVGSFEERKGHKYISDESFNFLRCKEVLPGDLLICRLAEPAGRACVLPDIGEDKVITSVDVTIARPPVDIAERRFLAQLMSTDDWFRAIGDRTGGTTHKRISRSNLGSIIILVPDLREQVAIADVLSSMDDEISALKSRLAKTKAIKQGMMQELLTGRTRLV